MSWTAFKSIVYLVKRYLRKEVFEWSDTGQWLCSNIDGRIFKLPYLGRFCTVAQSKVSRLVNRYCNDLDIKLVFTTFKLRNRRLCLGVRTCETHQ